jgi:hypothetical protein
MRLSVRIGALAVAVLAAACAGVALAQPGKDDFIEVRAKGAKKVDKIKGRIIDESPSGITVEVRSGKSTEKRTIPGDNIEYIEYNVPGLNGSTYRAPFNKELTAHKEANPEKRNKLLLEAAALFGKLEGEIRTRQEARRYVEFKAAILTARLADAGLAKAEDAIKMLDKYTAENRTAWQVLPALTTLARMQEDAGRPQKAREAYQRLSGLSGVDKEIIRKSEILVARLYLRSDKAEDRKEAQKRFEGLLIGISAADPEKPFLEAGLAECKIALGDLDGVDRVLNEAMKSAAENPLRGVLHNLLGEYQLKKGAQAEAFWHFLKVDALYNDLPEEQARALYHLGSLFDKVRKDPIRGRECYRRLQGKAFEGTAYQRRAKVEKKTGEEG